MNHTIPPLPAQTDILIIGAGPSGLALGAELRRLGQQPLIIERDSAGANTSRARVGPLSVIAWPPGSWP